MDGASNSRNCLYTCYLIAVVKGLFLEGWVGGTRLCPHPILRFFCLTFAHNQIFTKNFVNFLNIGKYSKLRSYVETILLKLVA